MFYKSCKLQEASGGKRQLEEEVNTITCFFSIENLFFKSGELQKAASGKQRSFPGAMSKE